MKDKFKTQKDYTDFIDSVFPREEDYIDKNIENFLLNFKDSPMDLKKNLIHSFFAKIPADKMEKDYKYIFSLLDKYKFYIGQCFAVILAGNKEQLVNNDSIFNEISRKKLPYYERFYLLNFQNMSIISTIIKSLTDRELLLMQDFINKNTMRITENKIPELLYTEISLREKEILLKNYENTNCVSRCLSRI